MTSRTRGFTLVEALIAAAIFAAITVALGATFRNVFSLRRSFDASLASSHDARHVLRPFADEVKSAGAGADGSFTVREAGTSTFSFHADVDDDGVRERVRYFVSGTELRRGLLEPTGTPLAYATSTAETISILARNVVASSTAFLYYGVGYDGSTSTAAMGFPVSPADVKAVRLWITLDANPATPPAPLVVTTFATIRNLRADETVQ